ncbi:MAG: isopeptide-forming domain-containing fimbrial protein [Bacteroidota bacterium]
MKPLIKLSFGMLLLIGLLFPQIAHAAGTPAGTVITNSATIRYKDLNGQEFLPVTSNVVTVIVDQIAGVDITPASPQTRGDSVWVYWHFVVTNTGNGKDVIGLSDVNTWPVQFFQKSDITFSTPITHTDSLAADASDSLVAKFFVPKGTADGTVDNLDVTATSQYTVSQHYGTDTARTARYVTIIQTAVLTVSKAVAPGHAQPDQELTYTITYTNPGSGPADSAVITDKLDSRYTFVLGSIIKSFGDTAFVSHDTLYWKLAYIPKNPSANHTGTLEFKVTINHDVPSGTSIGNNVNLIYKDSTSDRWEPGFGSSPPISVDQVVLGDVFPDTWEHRVTDAGMKDTCNIIIQNLGNGTDSVAISSVSSLGLSWTYYIDANHNGVLDPGETGTYDPSHPPAINSGDSLYLLAVANISHTTADQSVDTTYFYFQWQSPAALSAPKGKDTVNTTTTVHAPIISTLHKVVHTYSSPVDTLRVPGAILEYILYFTNTGHGVAGSAYMRDTLSQTVDSVLQYVSGSVSLNGTPVSDSHVNSSTGLQVITGTGTPHGGDPTRVEVEVAPVPVGSTATVKFRVKIL